MSAAIKTQASAGSLTDAPSRAADRHNQPVEPTLDSARINAALAVKEWTNNTRGLGDPDPLSAWRRSCRKEAGNEYAALENREQLLDAWDIAFDEFAPTPGTTSKDDLAVLRGLVSVTADSTRSAIRVLGDLLRLAISECELAEARPAASLIRAAKRYVDDIDEIVDSLREMEATSTQGNAL